MKSLGKRSEGLRLERMKASPRWSGDGFRNVHPILAGLRDTTAPRLTLSDFLCGGERRVPRGQLPSINPADAWAKQPDTGFRPTGYGHPTMPREHIDRPEYATPRVGPAASP